MSGETPLSPNTTTTSTHPITESTTSTQRPGTVSATTTSTTTISTMERLELLSRTAILKQGIEGGEGHLGSCRSEKGPIDFRSMGDGVIDGMGTTPIKISPYQHHQHQNSPCSISTVTTISTIPQKQIFPVDGVSAVRAISTGNTNEMAATCGAFNRTTNGPPLANIASPVSSDGDDHDDDEGGVREVPTEANSSTLRRNNNGHHNHHEKRQSRHHPRPYHPRPLVEARSPVATADFNRGCDAPPAALSFGSVGLPLIPSRSDFFGVGQPTGTEASFINYPTNGPPAASGAGSGTYHTAGTGGSASTFYPRHNRYDVRDESPYHHQLHYPDATPFLPPTNNDPSLFHYNPQTHGHNRSVTRSSTPTSAGPAIADDHEHARQHHHPHSSHRPPSQSFHTRTMDGQNQVSDQQQQQPPPSYEALTQDVLHMREQLKEKDVVVSALQQRVNYLENQISELRQLPTGKISHIPVE